MKMKMKMKMYWAIGNFRKMHSKTILTSMQPNLLVMCTKKNIIVKITVQKR